MLCVTSEPLQILLQIGWRLLEKRTCILDAYIGFCQDKTTAETARDFGSVFSGGFITRGTVLF